MADFWPKLKSLLTPVHKTLSLRSYWSIKSKYSDRIWTNAKWTILSNEGDLVSQQVTTITEALSCSIEKSTKSATTTTIQVKSLPSDGISGISIISNWNQHLWSWFENWINGAVGRIEHWGNVLKCALAIMFLAFNSLWYLQKTMPILQYKEFWTNSLK